VTEPIGTRARWWAEDYIAAVDLQVRGMTTGGDPHRYRSGHLRPCVAVPGVYEAWYFLQPVIEALHGRGHPVHVLTELRHNRRPVSDSAELLAQYVAEKDLQDVLVVAHSKGGLIGKYAMLRLDPEQRIARMVAIATPFAGSRYANWAPNRTLRAFRADDPTTSMLAAENVVNHRITSIYGRFDPIIPESSVLPGATNLELPVGGHFQVIRHPTTISTVVAAAAEAPAGQAGRMVDDNDKARLGERLNGHHDPKDPDGLITLDDVTEQPAPGREIASSEYPEMPGRFKSTPHDRHNDPV
jgi:pimeloyl-ACP methyl ester carboxylesterase